VSFHGFLGGARPAIKHPRHATAAKFAARALQLAFLRRGHRLLRDHALVAHANGHGLTGGRVARVSGARAQRSAAVHGASVQFFTDTWLAPLHAAVDRLSVTLTASRPIIIRYQ
jgi:hypothetical protein